MKVRAGFLFFCGLIMGAVLAFTLSPALTVSAESAENYEQWFEEQDVETVPVQSEALGGYLRFFYAQNCLYCRISYSYDGMTEKDNAMVTIEVSNDNRSYGLYFTADSADDFPCRITKYFSTPTAAGQDIYFKLEFSEKEDKNQNNTAVIRLEINGKSYAIAELRPDEGETVTEGITVSGAKPTEQSTKERETAGGTTKFVYSGGFSDSGSGTEDKTKFSAPEAEDQISASDPNARETQREDVIQDGSVVSVQAEKDTDYSPQAKAMFALSGVFAAAGTAFLIRRAVMPKSKNAAAESKEGPKEEI